VVLDRWPADRVVRLPLSPLIAVERIGVRDAAGVESDLAAALFHAETSADPPLIRVMATRPIPASLWAASRSICAPGSAPPRPRCRHP
jgi:hypothetical protein